MAQLLTFRLRLTFCQILAFGVVQILAQSNSSSGGSSLSPGVIAGIVVGAVVGKLVQVLNTLGSSCSVLKSDLNSNLTL